MAQVAIAIVWCILQVSLLSLIGGCLYIAARTIEPRLGRTTAAVLLGLVLVLSLAALSPWPSWPLLAVSPAGSPLVQETVSRTSSQTREASAPAAPAREGAAPLQPVQHPSWTTTFLTALRQELRRPPALGTASEGRGERASRPWSLWLVMLLGSTALLGSIRLVAACYALHVHKRNSRPVVHPTPCNLLAAIMRDLSPRRPIELRETPGLQSAATMGWWRPIILLPSVWREWPEDELRAVLAHEVAHIAARDWPTWLIAQVAVALHFYHPLVHWLAHRLRLEQELAADAAAATFTGSKERYLHTLAAQMLRADRARPAWAAQTFLPTRSTIVRRIEMLKAKSPQLLAGTLPGRIRIAAVAVLMAVGVMAAGFRTPGGDPAGALRAQETDSTTTDTSSQAGLHSFLPLAHPDALFFAYLRPHDIFEADELSPLEVQFNQLLAESKTTGGLKIEELEAFAVSPYLVDRHESVRIVLALTKPVAESSFQQEWARYQEVEKVGDYILYTTTGDASGRAAMTRDERMLVFDSSYTRLKVLAMQLAAGKEDLPAWLARAEHPQESPELWIALNMDFVGDEFRRAQTAQRQVMPLAMLAPLVELPNAVWATGSFADDFEIEAVAQCATPGEAQKVAATTEAFITMMRNMLAQQRKANMPEGTPQAMIAGTIEMADKLLKSTEVSTDGDQAQGRIGGGTLSQQLVQMGFVLPAIQNARQAAQRAQSMNNLKQLALAMHNYHTVHGHFPPPVLTGPDGKTRHSWRVALLPFLEQSALYDAYRLTEPWDSEHNKQVLESMPAAFRSPTEPGGTFNSAYYALVGEPTIFEPSGEGVAIHEIRDGTSNTIMLVEAKRDIPWTKPEDIPYSDDQPLPKLGGHFQGIFLVALADGSVHTYSSQVDPAVLRTYITKAQGERPLPLDRPKRR